MDAVLARLDDAFANVPRVGRVEGCTHCYTQAELGLLGSDPALVPDHLVARFAREAADHWSESQYSVLWRGFAPRILRTLPADPYPSWLLRGLASARVPDWPATQQAALRDTLRAMIAHAVADSVPADGMAELIYAAAHADSDLTPWLDHLDTLSGAAVDAAIAELARHWAEDLAGGGEPQLWWQPDDGAASIRAWLHSDALDERLNRMDDSRAVDALIAIAEIA